MGRAAGAAALAGLLLLGVAFYRPLAGMAWANRGAVRMAQIELEDFPSGQWQKAADPRLAGAQADFERALRLDPRNRSAHYRLGLIAKLRRDFPTAVQHLQRAYDLSRPPESGAGKVDGAFSRGIRKELGYACTWNLEFERALALLVDIPEAEEEMVLYYRWWKNRGRDDLAAAARQMRIELMGVQSSVPQVK